MMLALAQYYICFSFTIMSSLFLCQIKYMYVQHQKLVFSVLPFSVPLVSLIHLFPSLLFSCTKKLTYVLPLKCIWSFFRSKWFSFMQIKLRSVNRLSRLTEVREHSGCVGAQLLPSNTPRKQQPVGCASCSLPGGENHSDPLLCRRQRHHSASIRFLSLVWV